MGKGGSQVNNLEQWKGLFELHARNAFDFLISRFGFHYSGASIQPPECWIAYENGGVRITVIFELGSGPWVELERVKRERYDLTFLLMERAPGEQQRLTIRDLDDPRLPEVLRHLATLLERHGSDVLRGNFEVFPKLRDRAKEHLKRTNRELYGDT